MTEAKREDGRIPGAAEPAWDIPQGVTAALTPKCSQMRPSAHTAHPANHSVLCSVSASSQHVVLSVFELSVVKQAKEEVID